MAEAQGVIVFDHTNKVWLRKYRQTNGAETYSKELVEYQLDNWRSVLGPNDAISFCPRLSEIKTRKYDTVVQYLHSYPYQSAIGRLMRIRKMVRCKRMVFVAAYKAYVDLINSEGFEARFIPMSIDLKKIRQHWVGRRTSERIIYFGNVTEPKAEVYKTVKEHAEKIGWKFDTISHEHYNGKPITQEQAWKIVAGYRYGIGVGRCALEMYALGLRVLIAGQNIGGLVMNADDVIRQEETNFNGRYATFSDDPLKCLQAIGRSRKVVPFDIAEMNHTEFM